MHGQTVTFVCIHPSCIYSVFSRSPLFAHWKNECASPPSPHYLADRNAKQAAGTAKQPTLFAMLKEAPTAQQVDQAWSDFFTTQGIAFNGADNKLFHQAVALTSRLARHTNRDYKPPNRKAMQEIVVGASHDARVAKLKGVFASLRSRVPLTTDGWQANAQRLGYSAITLA